MKKRGYTLVELLGILAVMAIMLLITVPAIIRTMKNADNQKYIAFQNSITNAAELYYESDPSKYPLSNGVGYILVQDIIDAGYLKSTITDPKTGKLIDGSTFVEVKLNDDKTKTYTYPANILTIGEVVFDNVCSDTKTSECYKEEDSLYSYTGASGTGGINWLWYGGHLWRIISYNALDDSILIMTSQPLTSLYYYDDDLSNESFLNSYVYKWLNEYFYESLPDYVQSNIKKHHMSYTSLTASNQSGEQLESYVRILTKEEYLGSSSYMNIKTGFWLADVASVTNAYLVYNNGNMSNISSAYGLGVRPVIEVSSLVLSSGKGTISDPYVVSESVASSTSNLKVGDYVSVPKSDGTTYLTRVVSNNSDGIKVVLNGLYGTTKFGSTYTISNDLTIYTDATSGLNSFKNKLDLNYYDASDKNWYVGVIPSGGIYTTIEDEVFVNDIGLLTVGEMFSGNDIDISTSTTKTFVDVDTILNPTLNDNYWLFGVYEYNSYKWTYRIEKAGFLGNTSSTSIHGVRPTWYVKSVAITGGSGTANDPYTLK